MESWGEDHTHTGGPGDLKEAAARVLAVQHHAVPWWLLRTPRVGRATALVAAAAVAVENGLLARTRRLVVGELLRRPS